MTDFQSFLRNHYFTGKLLSAEDFQVEQEYHRGKSRLNNRFLHGWGIASGLEVAIEGDEVVVHPGYAIDCAGNDLLLPRCERLQLTGMFGRLFVTIQYAEIPTGLLPALGSDDRAEFSRVLEGVQLALATDNPASGHRGMGAGTPGCGEGHAITLATVNRAGRRWRVTPIKGVRVRPGR